MITLLNLQWGNCFSYGEGNNLDLATNPVTQLVGQNGSGKTTIPLLIQEALYNKNFKGIKKQDISNRYTGTPGYWINLKFQKDDDIYEIKQNRNKTRLTVTLLKNGEDISSHTAVETYKSLSEIIGISDFKMVSQLLYQSSTSKLEFLTATDTQRKKFLVSLLQLEKYLEYHEIFKGVAKELQLTIASYKGEVEQIKSWIEKHEKVDLTPMEEKEPIPDPQDLIDQLVELKRKKTNIAEINQKIVTNNKYKQDLKTLDTDALSKTVEVYRPEKVAALTEDQGKWKASMNRANAIKSKYSNLKDKSQCTTCFQEIDSNSIKDIIAEADKSIEECLEHIHANEAELKRWKKIKEDNIYSEKVQAEFTRLMTIIDQGMESTTLDANELNAEIAKLNSAIVNHREEQKKIVHHNLKASAHNSKIGVIAEQLVEFREDLVKKQNMLEVCEDEKHYVEILKNAFSTNGLLSYKIESSVKVLEDAINEYLAEFCFFRLEFKLEGEKLNIDIISDEGEVVSIESLSAGELARVNISTVLAIRKVMSILTRTKINFLFLDEIVGVLDDEGKASLNDILTKEALNTFIVSHESTHPLIPKIMVEKENNISRLVED